MSPLAPWPKIPTFSQYFNAKNLYFTGEVPAMTASVALPGGAVAAAARQVSGERSGDRTDREERLREQRIPVKEPAKGEPVMQRGRYLENQSSRSYVTG